MRKLSTFLIGCILASSLILCLEALAVPGAVPVPAWYTYPKVKRIPWGKNMERVVVYQPGINEGDKVTRNASDPATTPTDGALGEGQPVEEEHRPCNCARCAGNRVQKYVKFPVRSVQTQTGGKGPRFFFGSPFGYDDYYEEYEYDHFYPGYGGGGGFGYGGGYPGYGGGGGFGYGGGYPYGGVGGYPYGGW